MIKGITVIAALGLLSLVLGFTKINVYHHLELPQIDKHRIEQHVVFNPSFGVMGFYSTNTDIRLTTEIGQQEKYEDVIQVLQDAKVGDHITFHMYGYGGSVDTVLLLINNIRQSKGHVTMSVEGSVYSGHAYLAASVSDLVMAPMTFLMFHEAADEKGNSLEADQANCVNQTGTDRGISNIEHCIDMLKALRIVENEMIDSTHFLTLAEKQSLHEGHDVYIQADELTTRRGL